MANRNTNRTGTSLVRREVQKLEATTARLEGAKFCSFERANKVCEVAATALDMARVFMRVSPSFRFRGVVKCANQFRFRRDAGAAGVTHFGPRSRSELFLVYRSQ